MQYHHDNAARNELAKIAVTMPPMVPRESPILEVLSTHFDQLHTIEELVDEVELALGDEGKPSDAEAFITQVHRPLMTPASFALSKRSHIVWLELLVWTFVPPSTSVIEGNEILVQLSAGFFSGTLENTGLSNVPLRSSTPLIDLRTGNPEIAPRSELLVIHISPPI